MLKQQYVDIKNVTHKVEHLVQSVMMWITESVLPKKCCRR